MTPNDTKIRRNLGTSTEDLLTRLEVLSLLIGSSDHASAMTVRDAINTLGAQAEELREARADHLQQIREARALRATDEYAAAIGVIRARLRNADEREGSLWVNPFEVPFLRAALAPAHEAHR